jgi:hypothetical protein
VNSHKSAKNICYYIGIRMPFLIFLFFVLLVPGPVAQAQVDFGYAQQQLSIDVQPSFPLPESNFIVTVNDYAMPMQSAGFRWFVDGELVPEAVNKRELKLTAKVFGESTAIELVVDLASGGSVTAKRVIEPVFLDLIIEPQTRAPAFYHGRPLPSIGSTVNVTALINGNTISPNNLMYTWSVNNKVIEGGSMRGQNTVSFTMSQGRFTTLRVNVQRTTGEIIAERIIDITNTPPKIYFYENSTLYGLAQKTIKESIPLLGESITVRAEPYNLDLVTFNRPSFYEWEIGGFTVNNSNDNPYEVVLAAQGGGGSVPVNFHVRNTVTLLQGAEDRFTITY